MAVPKSRYKIWKAVPDTSAGFMVTPDFAAMAGSDKNFITASKEGVQISGSISLITTGEQIRQAGLFVNMNDFVKMIPSTIVTPIPSIFPFPPIRLFASIGLSLPLMIGMIAA